MVSVCVFNNEIVKSSSTFGNGVSPPRVKEYPEKSSKDVVDLGVPVHQYATGANQKDIWGGVSSQLSKIADKLGETTGHYLSQTGSGAASTPV